MARIRTIKPELWLSPQVMNLEHGPRLLFIGLITQADDYGRGVADARRLKAAVFPGDDVTCATVQEWLESVATQELAVLYDGGKHGALYALPTWNDHQYVQHRTRESRYPPPVALMRIHEDDRSLTSELAGGSEGSEGRKDLTRARAREGGARREEEAPVVETWLKGNA
jgi:hypothetical protein